MYFYSYYPQLTKLDREIIRSLKTQASDIEFFFRQHGFVLKGMTKRGHVVFYAADNVSRGLHTGKGQDLSAVLDECTYKHRISHRLPRNYKGSV